MAKGNTFMQLFCVLIITINFMSLLLLLLLAVVVCVSCLLLSRCLTVLGLISDNLSIPLSVCHYCSDSMRV